MKHSIERWEKRVAELRAIGEIQRWERRLEELRFNPYHDSKGRFTTAGGGSGKGLTNAKDSVKLNSGGKPFSFPSLQLPRTEYAHVCSEISSHYSRYEGRNKATIELTEATYWFENRGFGDYNIYDKL